MNLDLSSQMALVEYCKSAEFVNFATTVIVAMALGSWCAWFLFQIVLPAMAKLWDVFGCNRWSKVPLTVMFCGLVYIGATKVKSLIDHAGADEGIALVALEAEVVGEEIAPGVTNWYTEVAAGYTHGTLTEDTPFLGRDTDEEPWGEMEKHDVTFYGDSVTNWMFFTVSGKAPVEYRQLWFGFDPPDIHVVTEGVKLEFFRATPTSVEIHWSCDNPMCVYFDIYRRRVDKDRNPLSDWELVESGIEDTAWLWDGVFTIGDSWEYRVSSTYQEGN